MRTSACLLTLPIKRSLNEPQQPSALPTLQMNCIVPAQTGLSNKKSASKVRCQLQVCGIHSYLEIYTTDLYLENIKNGCNPMILNPGCTLPSPRAFQPFFFSPTNTSAQVQFSRNSDGIDPWVRIGQAFILCESTLR